MPGHFVILTYATGKPQLSRQDTVDDSTRNTTPTNAVVAVATMVSAAAATVSHTPARSPPTPPPAARMTLQGCVVSPPPPPPPSSPPRRHRRRCVGLVALFRAEPHFPFPSVRPWPTINQHAHCALRPARASPVSNLAVRPRQDGRRGRRKLLWSQGAFQGCVKGAPGVRQGCFRGASGVRQRRNRGP